MLTIQMKNGNVITYSAESYTDYSWKPNAFVVINGNQWVGIYNWDCVECVEYKNGKLQASYRQVTIE